MARTSGTVRLLFHSRTLILSVVGIAGIVAGVAVAHGDIGQAQLGTFARPLLAGVIVVLGFFAWLGWIDYASASSLAIDARGVSLSGRVVAWKDVRRVARGIGTFRLSLITDAGLVRFQLLVLPKPIDSLKLLVTEATKAGAKVEPYLARLADHVEDDVPESEEPDPP